ncbi:MAG: aconitase X swivel domain-containing protein [Gammaproteobacteria bacterium]
MKPANEPIQGRVLVSGLASGAAMKLDEALSFWGGFNPVNGEIIDVHHPQYKQRVGQSILCISQSRGSAGTPAAIAETLRNGSGPAAFLLARADINIAVGVMVANRLYDLNVPVIELSLSQMAQIDNCSNVQVGEDGSVTMTL